MSQENGAAQPETIASLVVGADICPTVKDEALFKAGAAAGLLGGYSDLLARADFTVVNLECPLTRADTRIVKNGPHLRAAPECVAFLQSSSINTVCLANNHIRDYGDQGVMDTLETCRAAGVQTLGAGRDIDAARVPLLRTVKGLRLGVMAMAEREFNLAGPGRPGANPIDYGNFTALKDLKAGTDFVLVIIHGGTEMLQLPRPGLVELCRFLVEQGAGAVVVQHTHCMGCYEIYRHAPIIYGHGNCIFSCVDTPVHQMDPNWFLGAFVELELASDGSCGVRFHPYEQSRGFAGLRPLQGPSREEFLSALDERSRILQNPPELCRRWLEYCERHRRDVLPWNLGIGGFWASVDSRVPFTRLLDALTDLSLRWNVIACESHRELLADCLRPRG